MLDENLWISGVFAMLNFSYNSSAIYRVSPQQPLVFNDLRNVATEDAINRILTQAKSPPVRSRHTMAAHYCHCGSNNSPRSTLSRQNMAIINPLWLNVLHGKGETEAMPVSTVKWMVR